MRTFIERIKLLKNDMGFVRYFNNMSWLFGGRLIQIIASVLIGVWVTRY